MGSPQDLVADQLRYYRARAAEYDVTSLGLRTGERRTVPDVVDRLAPTGDVLELACGTGVWTVELARHARTLTALDAAPEMLELATARAGASVHFVRADVFEWTPPDRYDVVFFAFWLSHVPPQLFTAFWSLVGQALRPGGRALFVDELPARSRAETYVAEHVVRRELSDGSTHRAVKVFYDPGTLREKLTGLGWRASVTPIEHDWFVGEATR